MAFPISPDGLDKAQMTHTEYVDFIEARILSNKARRQSLLAIRDRHLSRAGRPPKRIAQAASEAEFLNDQIVEDLALLSEVTSSDRT